MYRSLALVLGAAVVFSATAVPAQEAILGQLYGTGVHAYFGQDYPNAFSKLSAAITSGSKDPRVFYFRGLALLRLGRSDEAKLDFGKAAELEAADVNNFYNVARAIERVQGTDRLLVEQFRTNARMLAWQRAEAMRRERYEEIQRREKQVLRQQAELPAAAPKAPAAPTTPPAATPAAPTTPPAAAANQDPFAPAKPAAAEPPAPPAPMVEATEEAVEAPPAPEAVPSPFATPGPDQPAAPAAPAAKAAADDPFAKQPAEKKAPAKAPAAPAADAGDDPFK